MSVGEPAVARENNCLNAAKACNLNDTCKKYRSAYISPCTTRVSTAEICNKRKCHKALRQFFDKARHKKQTSWRFSETNEKNLIKSRMVTTNRKKNVSIDKLERLSETCLFRVCFSSNKHWFSRQTQNKNKKFMWSFVISELFGMTFIMKSLLQLRINGKLQRICDIVNLRVMYDFL